MNKLKLSYYFLKSRIGNMSQFNKSKQDLASFQLRKIKKLIKYAYRNCEFYRNKYDRAGLKPEMIRSLNDFRKIPILTRSELTGNFPEGFVKEKYKPGKNCFMVSTSGSTGEPIRIYKNYETIFSTVSLGSNQFMKKIFNLENLRMMTILVYAEETIEFLLSRFLDSIKKIPFRKVNALDDVENYIKAINEFKPTFLMTYPSVLKDILLFQSRTPVKVHSPELIITSAEILEPALVNKLGDVLPGTLIRDSYFCTEGGILAGQCGEGDKMHVLQNKVFFEILKNGSPAAPGVPGDVVITDLNNYATPIIRYNGLRDIAQFSSEPCSCGMHGEFIDVVAGRKVDSIITPAGKIINPFRLTEIVSVVNGIGKYQIHQVTESMIKVKIILINSDVDKQSITLKLLEELGKVLGNDVNVMIEFTDQIQRSSGSEMFELVKSDCIKNDY